MEVIFAPEATRAEVATLYPGARLDALPDRAGADADPGRSGRAGRGQLIRMTTGGRAGNAPT